MGVRSRPCFEISKCNKEKNSESSSHRGHKAGRKRQLRGNERGCRGGRKLHRVFCCVSLCTDCANVDVKFLC